MDAKAKRKVIGEMLAKLQRDMDLAVEQMPDDWTRPSWAGIWSAGPRCSARITLPTAYGARPLEHAVRNRQL
jgi:hypothetical protein